MKPWRKKTVEAFTMQDTGSALERLCCQYHHDVAAYDTWEIGQFHNLLRCLEYIPDPCDEEFIQRPKITLSEQAPHRDCDDKACAMGAWLYRHGIPFRFVACSYKQADDIHHCVIQLGSGVLAGEDESSLTKANNMVVDCTYEHDEFPPKRDYYNILPLTGWITWKG
jgi:hypothetical protein